MYRLNRARKASPLIIAALLGMLVVRQYLRPDVQVSADAGRFDHVFVVSPAFLYNGNPGVLLMDKRNGNLWFIAKNIVANTLTFGEPVFIARVPLEKLDQAPR